MATSRMATFAALLLAIQFGVSCKAEEAVQRPNGGGWWASLLRGVQSGHLGKHLLGSSVAAARRRALVSQQPRQEPWTGRARHADDSLPRAARHDRLRTGHPTRHMASVDAVGVWERGAEAAAIAASCDPVRPLTSNGCMTMNKVCMDQQQFIVYESKYQPHLGMEKPPTFEVGDLTYNFPNPTGNGDKFRNGDNLPLPPVVIRPNSSEEAGLDLRHPVFSTCTVPLVLYIRWPFNVGETFETSYAKLSALHASGELDPGLSPILATPHGMRVPSFVRMFYNSLFKRGVVSLADASSRLPPATRSNNTAEGKHVRCFEKLVMCKIRNRQEIGLYQAAQHLVKHYGPKLPPIGVDKFDPEKDRDALKVVVASRPGAGSRTMLNEAELLKACNELQPAEVLRAAAAAGSGSSNSSSGAASHWARMKCVTHVFGNMVTDMALMRTTDVLVCVHGAACYNAFFMLPTSSMIEIRPYQFPPSWANGYYAKFMELDKEVFWYGIDISREVNSKGSEWEDASHIQGRVKARERHVRLPWPALRHHLEMVIRVGGSKLAFKEVHKKGEHYILETLQHAHSHAKIPAEMSWDVWEPGAGAAGTAAGAGTGRGPAAGDWSGVVFGGGAGPAAAAAAATAATATGGPAAAPSTSTSSSAATASSSTTSSPASATAGPSSSTPAPASSPTAAAASSTTTAAAAVDDGGSRAGVKPAAASRESDTAVSPAGGAASSAAGGNKGGSSSRAASQGGQAEGGMSGAAMHIPADGMDGGDDEDLEHGGVG